MRRWSLRLTLALALLCARPALAAIACDGTAHSGHTTLCENLTASVNSAGGSAASLTTPSFSTGAGPILFVGVTCVDASGGQFPGTMTNTSGLTWTKRVAQVDGANAFGCEVWTAFSLAGSLTSQTVTFTLSNATTGVSTFFVGVYVLNGGPSTEAGWIGNTGGWIDIDGSTLNQVGTQTVVAQVTPASTGAWLIGGFGQANNTTVLAANGAAAAWDFQFTTTHSDNFAMGRFKSSGTVATTTSGSAQTFGSSTTEAFGFSAALEVRLTAPAAGGAVIYGRRGTRGAGQ